MSLIMGQNTEADRHIHPALMIVGVVATSITFTFGAYLAIHATASIAEFASQLFNEARNPASILGPMAAWAIAALFVRASSFGVAFKRNTYWVLFALAGVTIAFNAIPTKNACEKFWKSQVSLERKRSNLAQEWAICQKHPLESHCADDELYSNAAEVIVRLQEIQRRLDSLNFRYEDHC